MANHQLGVASVIIAYRVQIADNERRRFLLLNEVAGLLDEAEGVPPSKGLRSWRSQKGDMAVSVFLRSLALECRDDGVAVIEHLWREVLSLDQVWADLSVDFADEDVVLPEHRERMDKAKSDLRELANVFGVRSCQPSQRRPSSSNGRTWSTMLSGTSA